MEIKIFALGHFTVLLLYSYCHSDCHTVCSVSMGNIVLNEPKGLVNNVLQNPLTKNDSVPQSRHKPLQLSQWAMSLWWQCQIHPSSSYNLLTSIFFGGAWVDLQQGSQVGASQKLECVLWVREVRGSTAGTIQRKQELGLRVGGGHEDVAELTWLYKPQY